MFLRAVEISNWRSLEHVELHDLEQFNVLIGRNNTGKSAVFNALAFLGQVMNNRNRGVPSGEEPSVLTRRDQTRSLGFRLLFDLVPSEREEFIAGVAVSAEQLARRSPLLASPFARKVEFRIRSPAGKPEILHVRETRILAENGRWALCQQMRQHDDDSTQSPTSRIIYFPAILPKLGSQQLNDHNFSLDCIDFAGNDVGVPYNGFGSRAAPAIDPLWLQARLARYLADSFFFNPFRHSQRQLPAQEMHRLSQDGSNLPQVLATLQGHDHRRADRINNFISAAVPEIGTLQAPLRGSGVESGFLLHAGSDDPGHFVHLHDMGGGIEQLVMVATVLLTTDVSNTLFLEEPESHLHPAAQRFLLEKLRGGDRQVFLTTHSPVFLNAGSLNSLHRVISAGRLTSIVRVKDPEALAPALDDIGARNSDVLLSDAVLFVEGPGDKGAFAAWSETLGTTFEERNITVLSMGGGEHALRSARVRSEVLEDISKRSQLPHLFVLDGDERGEKEIAKLQLALSGKLHLLQAREVENYLLAPRAILSVLVAKYANEREILASVQGADEKQVGDLIRDAADALYGLVLLKRIRAEIPGFQDGFMPRAFVDELAGKAREPDLASFILERLDRRAREHIDGLNVEVIVSAQKQKLDEAWADAVMRPRIAPGEEILCAVFQRFGAKYNKSKDTERIARAMHKDEISEEVKGLITRILALNPKSV